VGGEADQDHPGVRGGADLVLRGDQGGQADRVPAGEVFQVQDQLFFVVDRVRYGAGELGGRGQVEGAGDGQDGAAVLVAPVQAERRAGRGEGEADRDQGAVAAGVQAGLVGDLADQGQAVAGLGAPLDGVGGLGRVWEAVVGDLAAQGRLGAPDPEAAVAGAVAHRVGGQFVDGDDQVVGAARGQAGLGGVRGHRRAQRVQGAGVEGLVQDGRGLWRCGFWRRRGFWWRPAVAVSGHRRSPGSGRGCRPRRAGRTGRPGPDGSAGSSGGTGYRGSGRARRPGSSGRTGRR
jgi:hypothetical protein